MHILIVNFNLDGITRPEFESACDELAPTFAAIPGLVCKHWLADESTELEVEYETSPNSSNKNWQKNYLKFLYVFQALPV